MPKQSQRKHFPSISRFSMLFYHDQSPVRRYNIKVRVNAVAMRFACLFGQRKSPLFPHLHAPTLPNSWTSSWDVLALTPLPPSTRLLHFTHQLVASQASAMQESPFLQVALSIQNLLQPYLALSAERSLPRHTPLFDPRAVLGSLQGRLPDVSHQLSTLGLPEELSAELAAMLTEERVNHQHFVESTRQRLLEELSVSTVSSNPSAIPSLVEAACGIFYDMAIDSGLESVRKHLEEFALHAGSMSDGDGASDSEEDSSSSEAEDGEDLEVDMEVQEIDDDENTPMRPGEEVPPLDTKYLPIFEALHERGKVLTKPEKTYLVNMTGMTYRQITIWFQNRRRGELKEDLQMRASSSHAASVHSLDSSDASEDEMDLEQRFSNIASDTTFDIRSWRLTSALPAKNSLGGSSFPSSPTKLAFGSSVTLSDADTDDTDLSDLSDDETNAPPGLQVPSLSTSFTTLDSASLATSRSVPGPAAVAYDTSSGANPSAFSRLVKPLPPSRRTPPQARVQSPPVQQTSTFSFNFASAPAQNQPPMPAPAPVQPAQFVTSNERGLTVEMDTTPPTSMATLQPSSSPSAPSAPASFANTSMPVVLPSSPPMSTGSPHSAPSPTPSAQCASSPRPAVKPLPRRTGCAPRPRPPPRAGSVAAPIATSVTTPSSARSSVVLPPSSNPSLGNTTLGALLRPSLPAPKIPAQMEERLSAMAGRMGVGSSSDSARRSISTDTAAHARSSFAPSVSALPPRGSPFTFGPTTLPGVSTLPGSTLAPVPGQQAQTRTSRSPSS